jgi:hypothetical protein
MSIANTHSHTHTHTKVDMPTLSIAKTNPPPCYRTWTTVKANMTVEVGFRI